MNKKLLAVILVVAVAGVIVWVKRSQRQPQAGERVINISALLPLTGPSADIGKWQQRGLMLAQESIDTAAGGGPKVNVVYEDTAGDVKTGLSAFEKAASSPSTSAYIIALSSVANAIAPRVLANPRPCLLLAVSLPKITERSEDYFRFNLGSEQEAEAMAAYLRSIDAKRIAVLNINDEFGVGALAVFRAKYVGGGSAIVFSEAYESEQTDFRTTILKLAAEKPEGIYVIGYVKSSVILIKQIRELGIKSQVFGNMALSVPSFLTFGGEALSGAVFTVTDFRVDSPAPASVAFVRAYQQRYGEPPTFFAAFAHDSLLAIEHAAMGGTPLRQQLVKLPPFSGVTGSVSFDAAKNLIVKVRLVRNNAGTLVEVK